MMDLARVQKELNECNRDVQVSGIRVSLKADSLTHLIGSIPGPQGTPYEGGVFKIDITLPGNFFFFFLLLRLSALCFVFVFVGLVQS